MPLVFQGAELGSLMIFDDLWSYIQLQKGNLYKEPYLCCEPVFLQGHWRSIASLRHGAWRFAKPEQWRKHQGHPSPWWHLAVTDQLSVTQTTQILIETDTQFRHVQAMQLTHPILIFWLTSANISGNLVSLLLHRCLDWAPKSGSTGSALVLSLKLTPQRLPCDPGDLVPNPWMNPRNQLTTVNSEMIID